MLPSVCVCVCVCLVLIEFIISKTFWQLHFRKLVQREKISCQRHAKKLDFVWIALQLERGSALNGPVHFNFPQLGWSVVELRHFFLQLMNFLHNINAEKKLSLPKYKKSKSQLGDNSSPLMKIASSFLFYLMKSRWTIVVSCWSVPYPLTLFLRQGRWPKEKQTEKKNHFLRQIIYLDNLRALLSPVCDRKKISPFSAFSDWSISLSFGLKVVNQ